MLYNTTHKFTKLIEPPSQEEIYNCPYYFSMSYEQIKAADPPQFLLNILDQFPFDGRQNIIQVRPQDFRKNIIVDGKQWHTDVSARLLNDKKLFAKKHDDWHLMLVGQVVIQNLLKHQWNCQIILQNI